MSVQHTKGLINNIFISHSQVPTSTIREKESRLRQVKFNSKLAREIDAKKGKKVQHILRNINISLAAAVDILVPLLRVSCVIAKQAQTATAATKKFTRREIFFSFQFEFNEKAWLTRVTE